MRVGFDTYCVAECCMDLRPFSRFEVALLELASLLPQGEGQDEGS